MAEQPDIIERLRAPDWHKLDADEIRRRRKDAIVEIQRLRHLLKSWEEGTRIARYLKDKAHG